MVCSTRVIGIIGSDLHLINNYPSIIDESGSSGPALGLGRAREQEGEEKERGRRKMNE